jgi:uncharacterized protein YjbJ (UPF0337 family)
MKGKVKQQWGKLTDDDRDVIAGKQDELDGRLQQRYAYAKDRAKKEVNEWPPDLVNLCKALRAPVFFR